MQLIRSAFEGPLGRNCLQSSDYDDKAEATSALSLRPSNKHRVILSISQTQDFGSAKPSTVFPSELPPRPQREPIFKLRTKRKASFTGSSNHSPTTLPSSHQSTAYYSNPAYKHNAGFLIPPMFLGSGDSPSVFTHSSKEPTLPGPRWSTKDPLIALDSFTSYGSLSPKYVSQSTFENNNKSVAKPSKVVSDPLVDRFARLKVGTGAPATLPSSASHKSPSACGIRTQPRQPRTPPSPNSKTMAATKPPETYSLLPGTYSLLPQPVSHPNPIDLPSDDPPIEPDVEEEDYLRGSNIPLVRRKPVARAPCLCAKPSGRSGEQPEFTVKRKRLSGQEKEKGEISPSPSNSPYRKLNRPNFQNRGPSSTLLLDYGFPSVAVRRTADQTNRPRERSRSPDSEDELAYPDLTAAFARRAHRVQESEPLPVKRIKAESVDEDAALAQEQSDRKLAEALQRQEDQRYNGVMASASDEDRGRDGMSIFLQLRENNASVSDRRNGRYFGRGTRHEPVELDCDEFDPNVEMGENNNLENTKTGRDDIAGRTKAEQAPTVPEIECVVCSESLPLAHVPSLATCTHVPQTCPNCFATWIESELEKKGWQSIKCPGSDCRVILAHHEVQQYATRSVFEQYDLFVMRAALGNDPNFRWCRAPGCTSGQIHLDGEDGNIFRCVACGHKVCVVHNDTFHEGETCKEFDYRTSGRKERDQRKQEEASERAVKQLSKVCHLRSSSWCRLICSSEMPRQGMQFQYSEERRVRSYDL
jgi:hypothetical protein